MSTDLIEWLADAQLHHYLCGPLDSMPTPDDLRALDVDAVHSFHWAERLGYLEHLLDYEPRALAVNALATKVAVGTKSGAIFLATYDPSGRRWDCVRHEPTAYTSGHAIRGLTFLGDDSLVASTGIGEIERLVADAQKWDLIKADLGVGGRSQRCTRVLRLPVNAPGPAMFLTRDTSVFLLRKDRTITWEKAGDLLDDWDPNERIVDGRMHGFSGPGHQERLVVLGAWGTVRVYSWSPDGACRPECHTQIVPPTTTGVFRGLAKWPGGLAVLASDYVTCVAYPGLQDVSFADEKIRPQWLHSPDATSITAWRPFHAKPGGSHTVVVYVSSAVSGLSFVRWHLETNEFALLHRPVRLPVTTKPRGVVLVAARTQEQKADGNAPALLAFATWDHRLVITSILDRSFVKRVLNQRCRPQTGELLHPGSTFCELLANTDSLESGSPLTRQQEGENSLSPLGDPSSSLAVRLRVIEADELVRLADRVIHQVKEPTGGPFEWLLAILERAQELNADERQIVHRFVAERLEHAAASRDAAPFARSLWREFRKWVVQGPIYGHKQFSLGWLAYSNRKRPLDALQFRTRLLRHRVDLIWSAEGPRGLRHRASVWAVAVSPLQAAGGATTGCVLQCQDDGTIAITQFDLTGRELTSPGSPVWPEGVLVVGEAKRAKLTSRVPAEELATHGLRLTLDGTLVRIDSREFIDRYNFGPYARRLVLLKQPGSGDRLIALFALHGWREADRAGHEQRKPRLVMLEFAPKAVGERWEYEISDVASSALDDELYAIESVPGTEASAEAVFIVGLAKPVRHDGRRVPFLRVNARLRSRIGLSTHELNVVDEAREGAPSTYAAATPAERNECRAMAIRRSHSKAGGYRIFAGFHNGHVVEYSMASLGHQPKYERRIVQTSSSIRCLAADEGLLAYGTAAGTLGAIDISRTPDQGPLPFHVVHSAERQPLSLVAFIKDGRKKLLSITQNGTLCLHDVDTLDVPSGRTGEHVLFPGYRIDRFRVGRRALVASTVTESPARRPLVIVGDDTGAITCVDLVLPRGTPRRHYAGIGCDTLWADYKNDPDRFLPVEMLERWLRVFELGSGFAGNHVARFSAWTELRDTERHGTDAYLSTLKRLSDDAFSRRPFTSETGKILWEEGGRFAKRLAIRALESNDAELWRQCSAIHNVINGMGNRWLGQERTFEDGVLAHSFRHLFAWPYIDLLCSTADSESAGDLRQVLVFGLAQRRLAHAGDLVPLETVKTLNAALIRSIARIANGHGTYKPASFGGTRQRVALYDLAVLVGQLGRRLGDALTVSHPLFSEMARFFALTLLRAPEHSLLIFQVLSEGRLTRRHESMADAVLDHAQELRQALTPPDHVRIQDDLVSAWASGLSLFKLASATEDGDIKQSWETLGTLETPRRAIDTSERVVDNAAVLREMKYTFEVADALAQLPRRESEDALNAISADARAWLDIDSTAQQAGDGFYAHTRGYFQSLVDARKDLIKARDSANLKEGQEEALQRCDREIQRLLTLPDLFEPQRTQYAAMILRSWRRLSEEPAARAYQLLHVLNKFNRHVYRAQTDTLMARVVDLALQTSPRWFDDGVTPAAATRFHLDTKKALEHNPSVEGLYAGVFDIVADSHLVGTLLSVAYEQLFERRRRSSATSVKEFLAALRHEAALVDVRIEISNGVRSEGGVLPGATSVWTAVLGELCRNLHRHGVKKDRHATCRVDDRGRLAISVYGDRPFFDLLPPFEQESLTRETARERGRALKARAEQSIRRPASDRPDSSSSGGGYGLLMIDFICQLLSLEFTCSLKDSADDPDKWPFMSTIMLPGSEG